MKKTRREFFEVFRRVPEEKEPTTWWRKNPEAASAEEPTVGIAAAAKPLPRRETAAPSNKVGLTLSRELLVVIAVAAVLALEGAFVWGHSLGSSSASAVAANSGRPGDAPKTPALVIQAANQPALPYYTLRLALPSIDHQNAERIAADLAAMDFEAFSMQASASSWSVNIGRVPNYLSADAVALKKKVSSVMYKNRLLACSWVKVIK